jgi:nucleolar pre-ribosomal-associated protein 1
VTEAVTSLVLKSALLPWIEAQLQVIQSTEAPMWARILENVLIVADSAKLESGTYTSWRPSIARCLLALLEQTSKYLASRL